MSEQLQHRESLILVLLARGTELDAAPSNFEGKFRDVVSPVQSGDLVITYKTYHGTHRREFLGIPATGKKVSFYTVDAMRVVDGKITEHWGVATLLFRRSVMTTPIAGRGAGHSAELAQSYPDSDASDGRRDL